MSGIFCLSKVYNCLPLYEFISDQVVEEAFDIVAPILASFGSKQPLGSKYKVPLLRD